MKETVLVFCAHSDDEVVGMGGTLLKYKDQKKRIVMVVFSFGEKSHPHLRRDVIARKRARETKDVDDILKRETIFFGLNEGKIKKEVEKFKIKGKIEKIISKYGPSKIFSPSSLDPHPDHRAVNKTIKDVLLQGKFSKYPWYTFEIWNVVNENLPVVYEDITDYFSAKMALLKKFKSQWLSVYLQLLPIYFRAKSYGRKNNCRYAEKFYKIR